MEERCKVDICNDLIIDYTDSTTEPIINGRYLTIGYLTCQMEPGHEFIKCVRSEAVKRLPRLGPRIRDLYVNMGRYMSVLEMLTLLKSSRNASSISWDVLEGTIKGQEKLKTFFERLKVALESENLSYTNTKTLEFGAGSEIELDFWADYFIHYFPNLENLKVKHYDEDIFTTSIFLEKIDDLGKLERIQDFSCTGLFSEEISKRLLKKSYSFTKLDLQIFETNTSFLESLFEKYKGQIEELCLEREMGFDVLHIPPMRKLRRLKIKWSWCKSIETDLVLISEDEEAYPKLHELKFGGYYSDILMVGFRNICKNSGVSPKILKITVKLDEDAATLNKWTQIVKEAEILRELNRLFPNSSNKMYKKPDVMIYKRGMKKKRCIIS